VNKYKKGKQQDKDYVDGGHVSTATFDDLLFFMTMI